MARLPIVHEIGKTEEPPDQARFRMLGSTSEEIVMVEVKIHHFAFAIDRKTGDVEAKVPVPADALSIVGFKEITFVPKAVLVDVLAWGLLTFALRIDSHRAIVVAIPEAHDQGHKEERKDAMALLNRLVG